MDISQLPIFKTKRLALRPVADTDFQFLRKLDTDLKIMKFVGGPKSEAETLESFNKNYERYKNHGIGLYIVVNLDNNENIGRAGLFAKKENDSLIWEIGCSLIPEAWGKGYATEICLFLRDWALNNLDTSFVVCVFDSENSGSKKIAQKLGMTFWKKVTINNSLHVIYRT